MRKLAVLAVLAGCAPMPEPMGVTRDEFARLEPGMNYYQVTQTLGAQLTLVGEAGEPGRYKIQSYSWTNADGSNIRLSFTNDKLTTMAQAGLR